MLADIMIGVSKRKLKNNVSEIFSLICIPFYMWHSLMERKKNKRSFKAVVLYLENI